MKASPHSCVNLDEYDPRCLRCVAGDEAQIHELNVTRVVATYPDGEALELNYLRGSGWCFPEQRSSPGFDHAAGYPN